MSLSKKSRLKKGIIFFQGIECKSVDFSYNNSSPYKKLVYGLSKLDYSVIRVDLYGNGDSQGAPVSDYTFYDIVDLYRAIVLYFDSLGYEIYIFGYSIGGVIAPIIATMLPTIVKGIIVFDTIVSSLYTYLLKNRLRQELLQGYSSEYIKKSYELYANVLDMLLLKKKDPKYIFSKNENAKKYFSDDYHFIGHTCLYAQQISDLNLWEVWREISVPVLLIVGEQDFTIDYNDHIKLYEILRKKGKDRSILLTAPINHFFMESNHIFSFTTMENIKRYMVQMF